MKERDHMYSLATLLVNMEKKRTALDILFQEIKESKSFLPDNLFDYLEMVYNKAKEIEKEHMIEFADKYGFDVCHFDYDRAEEYYDRIYKQQDNG
jgi:hypothetical protein